MTTARTLAARLIEVVSEGETEVDMSPRDLRRAKRFLRRGDARSSHGRATGGVAMWDRWLGVACPVCRAEPGKTCSTRRGRAREGVHRARRNLVKATAPSCEPCGACCLARVWGDGSGEREAEPFVWLFPGESLEEEALAPPDPRSETRSLRVENGRCSSLLGVVPGARCAIYERRPLTCRAFEAGSFRCRVARSRAGVEKFADGVRR